MNKESGSTFGRTILAKGALPPLPWKAIKEAVLGKGYRLSLVFVGDARSKELNLRYRRKNKPTNVLSFPLEKNEGEIFLNLRQIRREEKKFGVPFPKLAGRMFIHGLFHLKGHTHGSMMEKQEAIIRDRFHY